MIGVGKHDGRAARPRPLLGHHEVLASAPYEEAQALVAVAIGGVGILDTGLPHSGRGDLETLLALQLHARANGQFCVHFLCLAYS